MEHYNIFINQDSLLEYPKMAFEYIAFRIYKELCAHPDEYDKIRLIVSEKYFQWITQYWPCFYLQTNSKVIDTHSFWGRILNALHLTRFSKMDTVTWCVDKSSLLNMQEDIIKNRRILFNGIYFSLLRDGEHCEDKECKTCHSQAEI